MIRPLTDSLAERVSTWFEKDPTGSKVFGDFYGVHPKWWELVNSDHARLGWLIADKQSDLGFVDLEIVGAVGNLSFCVTPTHRGKGHGRMIVDDLAIKGRQMGLPAR